MVSTRSVILGSARLPSSIESSRIESISLVVHGLSNILFLYDQIRIKKEEQKFPGERKEDLVTGSEIGVGLPLNGLITSGEVKSNSLKYHVSYSRLIFHHRHGESFLLRERQSKHERSVRKVFPRRGGLEDRSHNLTMTKSAGNVNFPTRTKTSLAIPAGVQIARLASSRVMRVEISSGKPNFFHTESGIKLMLAPRSARALHLSSLKPHGMRNFPGSPSFSGNFLRITAEQFSFEVFSPPQDYWNGGGIGNGRSIKNRTIRVVDGFQISFRWVTNTPGSTTIHLLQSALFQSLRRKTPLFTVVDQKFNSFLAKSFSEDVRQLILHIDKVKFDHPILNMLLDKVKSLYPLT
ncbi:hypothetical protein Tco_0290902 [Tanacetum coccineum]